MAVDFKNSETKLNLMRSFAGESQARNRYTIAASQAKKQNLHVIEAVFTYTANQEREHAEIFYNYLKGLGISDNLSELLRMAQHNEYEEHDDVYKNFGEKAKEEGFHAIANSFFLIAEIEKVHGDRFGRFAELMEKDMLFRASEKTRWICLNCGYIYEGEAAPQKCPVCVHDQGYFIRLDQSPYES